MINRREANALRGRKNCVSSTVPKNLSIEGWSHVVSSTVLKCVWPEDRSRVPIKRPMHCHVSGLHSRGQCPLHAPHTSPVTTVKTAQQGQGTVSTPRPTHLPSDHFEPCRGHVRIPQEENWMNMYPLVTTTTASLYVITRTHVISHSSAQNKMINKGITN